eukprot:TRINITY_DN57371_c0_g1_i1.p1 TRINITY_DN57371_c0_g1~~TRINITY_DN57371_c0_g1_i1.p1  ORF type:complete len:363 (-),score=56.33 TRINITY_DN57371_c0_g1_i1:87-1175(-)
MAAVSMSVGGDYVAFAPMLKRTDRQEFGMPLGNKNMSVLSPVSACLKPMPARPSVNPNDDPKVPISPCWHRPKLQVRSSLPPLQRCATQEGFLASLSSNGRSAMEEDLDAPAPSLVRGGHLERGTTGAGLSASASAPSLGADCAITTQKTLLPQAQSAMTKPRPGSRSGRNESAQSAGIGATRTVANEKTQRRSKRRMIHAPCAASQTVATATKAQPAPPSGLPAQFVKVAPPRAVPDAHETKAQAAPEMDLECLTFSGSNIPKLAGEVIERRVQPGELLDVTEQDFDDEDFSESDYDDTATLDRAQSLLAAEMLLHSEIEEALSADAASNPADVASFEAWAGKMDCWDMIGYEEFGELEEV